MCVCVFVCLTFCVCECVCVYLRCITFTTNHQAYHCMKVESEIKIKGCERERGWIGGGDRERQWERKVEILWGRRVKEDERERERENGCL